MRTIALGSVVFGLVVLGTGCIFSPDHGKPPDKSKPQYPLLTSPENVMEALQMAYQRPDSDEVKVIYDENYTGSSQDVTDPPGTNPLQFVRQDEIDHVHALQNTTTISSVVFDIGPLASLTRLPSDDLSHPQWAQIQINYFHVEIFDNQTLYTVQSINPISFYFAPTVVAPGDTTWKIIKWTEVGSSSASGGT